MIPRMLLQVLLPYTSILLQLFYYWCCCSTCYGWIQHNHYHQQQQHPLQHFHQSISQHTINRVSEQQLSTKSLPTQQRISIIRYKRKRCSSLLSSSVSESDATVSTTETVIGTTIFTTEEINIIENLAKQFQDATSNTTDNPDASLRTVVMKSLESSSSDGSTGNTIISPTLLTKLRSYEQQQQPRSTSSVPTDLSSSIQYIIQCLNIVQENEYTIAKETLVVLLNAGEIRKLDNLIGKAARENKLNLPFFNVLNANIRDATTTTTTMTTVVLPSTTTISETTEATTTTGGIVVEPTTADRLSILKHIYTRCQEELEKTIPPGIALLNKLLRTDQVSIRTNLYKHYLLVPKTTTSDKDNNDTNNDIPRNVVVTPDGKIIQLVQSDNAKSLIDINDFINAMDKAIIQIRSLQSSNIVSTQGGNQMIESYKAIAKEIRIVISNYYGQSSQELINYQDSLQPIFCPPTSTTGSTSTPTETTSSTTTTTTRTSDNNK